MRCFSIVSSPNHPEELQFAIRIQGNFTKALADLNVGDSVLVRGPFGDFVMDEEYDRSVVMLAGGIGITAFISMIRYATELKLPNKLTLLYSNASQNYIPFHDELLQLEQKNPNFKTVFFVTNGQIDKLSNSHVLRGRITETRLSHLTGGRYNQFSYFICGPRSLIKGAKSILISHGTDSSRIVTEEFTPTTKLGTSIVPKDSVSRRTYALSGLSLIVGIFFIMSIDLVRAVPKLVSAQSQQISVQTPTNNTSAASSSPAATAPAPVTSSDTTASPAATPSSTANTSTSQPAPVAATPTPAPAQSTYQPPVTAVS
jgi:ferredoxin-NADP reductase